MARAADTLAIEERISRITTIFSTFRNPDKETVLTPWRVVNMHIGDCLGGYVFFDEDMENNLEQPRFVNHGIVTEQVFAEDSKILEINSKSGLYPLFMGYGIYKRIVDEKYSKKQEIPSIEEQQTIWDKVIADNIYVICKTPMAKSITKRTLAGFRDAKVNTRYFEDLVNQITHKQQNFLEKIKQGKTYWKSNSNDNMKFNAIVGNPPYQDMAKGSSTSDDPIYHHFMDISFKISEKVSFIVPGRFLFNAGKTPKDWNYNILNDIHFKVIWYESDSRKIFPNVDIKGGVTVFLRDTQKNFGKIELFTKHPELNSINCKVQENEHFESIMSIIETQNKFNLDALYEDYPQYRKIIGSEGKDKRLRQIIMERLDVFTKHSNSDDEYQILGLIEKKRAYRFIPKKYVEDNDVINKYKVFVTAANGSGAFGETLSTPLVGKPSIGITQTFISLGSFDDLQEAEALLKYVKSKFCRTLLGILKITQGNNRDTWAKVPVQDFTSDSDIDWSKSIPEIDKQLYSKYGLTQEEIGFIESMIKPME